MFQFIRHGKTKEERFWEWFEKNEERYYELRPDSPDLEALISQVHKQIQKVHRHLCCELGPHESQARTFFISAGGVAEAFGAVEALHAKAPALARWNFVKFKQRKAGRLQVKIMDKVYSDESITYELLRADGSKAGIRLFFDDFDPDYHRAYATVGFLFLDSLLGEYDVATRLSHIDFLPKAQGSPEAMKPLHVLPEEFDRWRFE